MIRNLVLAISTLFVIGLLFAGYTLVIQDPPAAREDLNPGQSVPLPDKNRNGNVMRVGNASGNAIEVPGGDEIAFAVYDERTGQPTSRFRCAEWSPIPGTQNEAAVKKPELTLLLPSGMVAVISADSGQLVAERFQRSRMRPKTGRLEGNARIVIDTETRQDRTPMSERPDDLITIAMDNLQFDAELGQLKTDGTVQVHSREFEIGGTGLEFLWNQSLNRVETLVLKQGRELTLHGGEMFRGLTGAPRQAAAAPGGPAGDRPSPPQETAARSAAPTPPPAATPGTQPAAPYKTAKNAKRANAYNCLLSGGVVAEHWKAGECAGRLEAPQLQVLFDLGGGPDRLLNRGETAEPPPQTAGKPEPHPQGRNRAATRPANETNERLVVHWSGPLTLSPAPLPIQADRPRRRLEALGPDVKLQTGEATALCGRLEYYDDTQQIWLYRGDAKRVDFTQGENLNASAESVYVDRKHGLVKLIGNVWLESHSGLDTTAKAGLISCTQWAELRLTANAAGAEPKDPLAGGPEDPLLAFGQLQSATFVGDVIIQMDDQTLMASQLETTFRPSDDGLPTLQGRLSSAVATGQVHLVAKNQALDCGRLELTFAQTPQGQLYPQHLEAQGSVTMAQDQAKLGGEKVVAELKPLEIVENRPQGNPAARPPENRTGGRAVAATPGSQSKTQNPKSKIPPASKSSRIVLQTLDVFGKASLIDPKSKVTARGQRISAVFAGENDLQAAMVSEMPGKLARVYAQPYVVRGQHIEVERAAQTLHIDGPSRLSFKTRRGLQGQEHSEPVPVLVTSTKSLHIDGRQNKVEFVGDVVAKSGTERLRAESLIIVLQDAPEPASAAVTKGLWKTILDFGSSVAAFSPSAAGNPFGQAKLQTPRTRKEPARLIARNGVVESETYEAQAEGSAGPGTKNNSDPSLSQPLTHSSIAAPLLEVDVPKRLVHTTGQTTLLLTNRRLPPDPAAPDHDRQEAAERETIGLPSALLTRGPSQTAMQCNGSMTYALGPDGPQRRDTVLFDGGVIFVHRAGREMVNLDQMLPDAKAHPELVANLKSRNTYLECQRLECEFLNGGLLPGSAPGEGRSEGLRLRWLLASGNAYLRDRQGAGIREVQAQRLEFDREHELVNIAGAPGIDARVYYENPETGQSQTPAVGQEFTIDLRQNTVRTGRVTGTSLRPSASESQPQPAKPDKLAPHKSTPQKP